MQLFIKHAQSGHRVTLDVEPTETIANVKAQIQDRDGVNAAQQRLIYAGQQLEDHRTLIDYHIPKEAELHLMVLPQRLSH
ncbi:putative Ubiquitin [Paratrimastix pyriformis]|uniref:Ubiquitin n=1 Tax=Paratrimastix pyriformis TaxID=342808 RepID=A0ABQ8UYC4_9EUKA|nr:putative Ubiquitin [Paratrimastix pyriformis]